MAIRRSSSRSKHVAALAAFVCALVVTPAHAAVSYSYTFIQPGYDEGAVMTGSFSATDLNGDGSLNALSGELTAFSAHFSGNSLVTWFDHTLADVTSRGGMSYLFRSPPVLGDDASEGLRSNFSAATGFRYTSGTMGSGSSGGIVMDYLNSRASTTTFPIFMIAVPEPEVWATLLGGLALLGFAARRSKRNAA